MFSKLTLINLIPHLLDTTFRSKPLEEALKAAGGDVKTSITKQTTSLIVKARRGGVQFACLTSGCPTKNSSSHRRAWALS